MESHPANPGKGTSPALVSVGRQTPWWVVSILAHGLILAIAALLTLVIEMPEEESECVPLVSMCSFSGKVTITAPVIENTPTVVMAPSDDHLINDAEIVAEAGILGPRPDFDASLIPGPADENISNSAGDLPQRAVPTSDEIGLATMLESRVDDTWSISQHNGSSGVGAGANVASVFSSVGMPRIIRCYAGGPRLPAETSALQWLAWHQEPDGHWDAVKNGAANKNDTAVTALALLAFLGAGNSEKVGAFKINVKKAVAWLQCKQAADGCIWDTTDDGATHRKLGYPHAFGAIALAEAAGMGNVPSTRAAAQKAIDYSTQIQQSASGGWRYAAGSAGDLSVTGWYIMALKSAKVAGLKVPASSFDAAIQFLDSVEIKSTGVDGNPVAHYKYMPDDEHAASAHRMTAIGTLARQYLGWNRDDLQASVEWFVKKGGVPTAGANGESVDLYYWFHGTLCCFQQGGELWQKWRDGLHNTLFSTQCRTGADAGSWNPTGEYSSEWGRVGQTALSALLLELRCSYVPLKR